jgi:hypothetical protein
MMSAVSLARACVPATALLVLALLSGCSPDGDDKDTDLPSDADLAAYFDAVASYDQDQLTDAQEIAADGSPAQGYVAYLSDFAASAIASGQPVPPAEAKEVDGGFEACGGTGAADECVTWADFDGEDGKLTDFTVSGVPVDDSLVDLTGQAPIESPGLYTVQPEYAYRSPQSGTLFVLVTITAGDAPLAPEPGIYIEQDRTLDGVETRAPKMIEPGASTPVILAFPKAEQAALDGSVTFGLGVGGTPESIGFELTEPNA